MRTLTGRTYAAVATVVFLMVAMLPLMAFGSSESQGQQQDDPKCYEKIEEHDWVRYRVQKSVWDTKQAYNNGQGAGAAYWVGEGSSSLVSHDPLTIEPLGSHDAPRVVGIAPNYTGASRFNVTSGGNYVANANGDYFYKQIDKEQKSQVKEPPGDGWIDLGGNGNMVNGKEIPCPTTTTTTVPVPKACPDELLVVKATNLDHNGWSVGGATFVNDGIRIDVAGEWEEVSISRAFGKSLKELGDLLAIDADPLQYVGLHFHTSEGIIVYEEEPTYNGNLWSKSDFGVGGGMGYASFAPLEAYVAENPDLVVTKVEVLYTHPQESSTVVASVIFGCEEFIFDFETTTTTMPETTTTLPETVCVDINAAPLEQLILVNGLKPGDSELPLAQRIIDGRPYSSIQDMVAKVDGIGPVSVLTMLEPDSETGAYISDECLTQVPSSTTTTVPEETTTTVVVTTTSSTPEELPFTGLDSDVMAALAVGMVALGGLALALGRKPEEDNIN